MQDTEKKGWGGARRSGKTKTTIAITIDTGLVEWLKDFGKLSPVINKILRNHKNHIEQMIKETDQANEL